MNEYDASAQHLGSMLGMKGKKSMDLKSFLDTPAGHNAARSAVESIIGTQGIAPLPIPAYQAILKTIQAQMGQE